jgi:hypothetical protein
MSVFVDPERDGDFAIRFEGLACVHVNPAGASVWVQPETEALTSDTIQHLVADHVIPRVLAHRGELVLHAGAVQLDESVIVLVGESGRGKSTLAASLTRYGWCLLGDDAVIVSNEGGVHHGRAVYRSLRLFPDSIASLYPVLPQLLEVAHYSGKRRVSMSGENDRKPCARPLTAMFFIAPEANGDDLATRRMSPAETCMGIIGHSFSLDPTDLDRAQKKLAAASALATNVPAFELCYPRTFTRLPDVRDAVCCALAEISDVAVICSATEDRR